MSAWSDAGWPGGIFFSRPRLAVNLIIEAINELLAYRRHNGLPPISEFTSRSALRDIIATLESNILMELMERLVLDADHIAGVNQYPEWLIQTTGDFPMLNTAPSIYPENWLLRWVVSRYKVLNQCNVYYLTSGSWEGWGDYGAEYKYDTEAERTEKINQWFDDPPAAVFSKHQTASRMRKSDKYIIETVRKSRFRLKTGYLSSFNGLARIGAAVRVEADPLYEFDASLYGPEGTLLMRLSADPTQISNSDEVILFDEYATVWPYAISPGNASVSSGANLVGVTVYDTTGIRRYYDPPEVWQNINV